MEPFAGFLAIAQWLSFLTCIAYIFGARIPLPVVWTVAGLVLAAFAWTAVTMIVLPGDAILFWKAGDAVWKRANPYHGTFVLNPPPSLIWYAALALIPQGPYLVLWRLLCTISFGGAAFAVQGALGREPKDRPWGLPSAAVALFASAVAISVSSRLGLLVLNSTFLTTVCILGALACRDRARPVAAGILLALASVKITTLLPFLLLFFRPQDRKTWIALIAAGLLFTVVAVPPSGLPAALRTCLANISEENSQGQMSDYSFESDTNTDLVSLNYAIYHLGIRDRGWVRIAQLLLTVALGIWVTRQIYRSPSISHAPACAIVACYSVLFLYHRLYDMTILAIPLIYCAGRGLQESGPFRWAYRLCAAGLLWVLHLRLNVLERFIPRAKEGGFAGRLIEAVLLPQATWIVLAALIVLIVTERRLASPAASPLPAAPPGDAPISDATSPRRA